MKYNPRKVFIKEDGDYKAISYEEFCNLNEMSESLVARKFVPIQGCLLEVDDNTYKEIYKEREQNRYVQKLERKNTVYCTETSRNKNVLPSDNSTSKEDLENQVINRIMLDKLKSAIHLLEPEESLIIDLIYYKGLSQRKVAKIIGIAQSSLEYKVKTAICKLKMFIEIDN